MLDDEERPPELEGPKDEGQPDHGQEMEFPEVCRKRFYVVAEGHRPGVYQTWIESATQVNGFPNNRHQAFCTRHEAERYIEEYGQYARAAGR